jgi:N-dimethylarginine dimethylaminohydrolase
VSVTPNNVKIAEPKEYSFNRLDKKEWDHFEKKFKHFKNHEKIDEQDAHSLLNMAVYLEEHNMILDATVAYEKAMNLAKGEEVFEVAYKQFLIRHGIAKASQFIEEEAKKGEEK